MGVGPCDFSVSPSPFGLDFGTLDFGTSVSGSTINAVPLFFNNKIRRARGLLDLLPEPRSHNLGDLCI